MDRRAQLLAMAYRMSRAAVELDWDELARSDQELSVLLPRLMRLGPWTVPEQKALDGLRTAHREALDSCIKASARLDARLADMCAHKEAWRAYSLDAVPDADGQEGRS